jgi:hypothetical protein
MPVSPDHIDLDDSWERRSARWKAGDREIATLLAALPRTAFTGDGIEYRRTFYGKRIKLLCLGEYDDGLRIRLYVGTDKRLYEFDPTQGGQRRFRRIWRVLMTPDQQKTCSRLLKEMISN